MSILMDENDEGGSRTYLVSHENMVVVGNHATILADTVNEVDVSPLIPDYQDLVKISIVHAEVQYTGQYMAMVYVIMFSNYLSVKIMDNNLIPPFITR